MDIFVSASGQQDNVGDALLRRHLLAELRRHGHLIVNTVGLSSDYTSGLELLEADEAVSDQRQWRTRVMAGMRAGSMWAFNSGEMQFTRTWGRSYTRLLPLLLLNRSRGGQAVHLGFGARPPSGAWRHPIGALLRVCDVVSWRDTWSRDQFGVGVVTADWAFAAPGTTAGERDQIAVSLRGDRDHSQLVASLSDLGRREGRALRLVTQVGRDAPQHARLARALGVPEPEWADNLQASEAIARAAYRRSRLVVTDRLHSAIAAITEGAYPVIVDAGEHDKLRRTLAPVGLVGVPSLRSPEAWPDAAQMQQQLAAALAQGQVALAEQRRLLDLALVGR